MMLRPRDRFRTSRAPGLRSALKLTAVCLGSLVMRRKYVGKDVGKVSHASLEGLSCGDEMKTHKPINQTLASPPAAFVSDLFLPASLGPTSRRSFRGIRGRRLWKGALLVELVQLHSNLLFFYLFIYLFILDSLNYFWYVYTYS